MITQTTQAQLLVTLLALLPKDGTPITVRALAAAAATSTAMVTHTLFDDWYAGRIGYDMPRDSYFCIRAGTGASQPQPQVH